MPMNERSQNTHYKNQNAKAIMLLNSQIGATSRNQKLKIKANPSADDAQNLIKQHGEMAKVIFQQREHIELLKK
jgi:hypothetical protein